MHKICILGRVVGFSVTINYLFLSDLFKFLTLPPEPARFKAKVNGLFRHNKIRVTKYELGKLYITGVVPIVANF